MSGNTPSITIRQLAGTFVPIWVLPDTNSPHGNGSFTCSFTVTLDNHIPPTGTPTNITVQLFSSPSNVLQNLPQSITFNGTNEVSVTLDTNEVTEDTPLLIFASLNGQTVSNEEMVGRAASPIIVVP